MFCDFFQFTDVCTLDYFVLWPMHDFLCFATYGCCHSCFYLVTRALKFASYNLPEKNWYIIFKIYNFLQFRWFNKRSYHSNSNLNVNLLFFLCFFRKITLPSKKKVGYNFFAWCIIPFPEHMRFDEWNHFCAKADLWTGCFRDRVGELFPHI